MSTPIKFFEKKRKRNHDIAYLTILLALCLGIFLFVTFYINSLDPPNPTVSIHARASLSLKPSPPSNFCLKQPD